MLTSLSAAILLLPIIILFFIGKGYPSLIVIVVCTALFSMVLAVTTEARNHEVMRAAAAYVNNLNWGIGKADHIDFWLQIRSCSGCVSGSRLIGRGGACLRIHIHYDAALQRSNELCGVKVVVTNVESPVPVAL